MPASRLDHRLLAIEWKRRAVLVHHRLDDYVIGEDRLRHDALRSRRCLSALFASTAGALLAFDHPHEVLGRAPIENLGFFVADHGGLAAALAAAALLGRAPNDLIHALKMSWQLLTPRMFAARLVGRLTLRIRFCRVWRQRLALALGFDLVARYNRLEIKKRELKIA